MATVDDIREVMEFISGINQPLSADEKRQQEIEFDQIEKLSGKRPAEPQPYVIPATLCNPKFGYAWHRYLLFRADVYRETPAAESAAHWLTMLSDKPFPEEWLRHSVNHRLKKIVPPDHLKKFYEQTGYHGRTKRYKRVKGLGKPVVDTVPRFEKLVPGSGA